MASSIGEWSAELNVDLYRRQLQENTNLISTIAATTFTCRFNIDFPRVCQQLGILIHPNIQQHIQTYPKPIPPQPTTTSISAASAEQLGTSLPSPRTAGTTTNTNNKSNSAQSSKKGEHNNNKPPNKDSKSTGKLGVTATAIGKSKNSDQPESANTPTASITNTNIAANSSNVNFVLIEEKRVPDPDLLLLFGCILDIGTITALSLCLPHSTHLTSIQLKQISSTIEGFETFNSFIHHTHIQRLYCQRWNLLDRKITVDQQQQQSSNPLIKLFPFPTTSTLQFLSLQDNSLSDEDGSEIAQLLIDNKQLVALDLSHNQLSHKSLIAFSRTLLLNSTLQYLSFSANPIDSLAFNAFISGCLLSLLVDKEEMKQLKKDGYRVTTTKKNQSYREANTTLKILCFSWCWLDDSAIPVIQQISQNNELICNLMSSSNEVNDVNKEERFSGQLNQLQKLIFTHNLFSPSGWKQLTSGNTIHTTPSNNANISTLLVFEKEQKPRFIFPKLS